MPGEVELLGHSATTLASTVRGIINDWQYSKVANREKIRNMETQAEAVRLQSQNQGGGALLRVSAEEIKATNNLIMSSGLTGDQMDWAMRQLSRLQDELDRNIDDY